MLFIDEIRYERIIVADVLRGKPQPRGPMVCCSYQQTGGPFFYVSSAVSTDPPAPTKRTEGVRSAPKLEPPSSVTDTRTTPVLVGPATLRQQREWRIRRERVWGFSAPSDHRQCRRKQTGVRGNGMAPVKIGVPKSPYEMTEIHNEGRAS